MRILFITAYFPPCQYGWGYMRVCEQVADGLDSLGHEVMILTSTYQDGSEIKSYPVHRLLPIDPDWNSRIPAFIQYFLFHQNRERASKNSLQSILDTFQPDIVFIWHAHGLSREMLNLAERAEGAKTVYYFANYLPEVSDEYIRYWKGVPKSKIVRSLKSLIARAALKQLTDRGKPVQLKYEHSISVSQYVRERLTSQGLIGEDAVVIPNGVDLNIFNSNGRDLSQNGKDIRLLLAGRVAPEKGIHTVLESLRILDEKNELDGIKLTVLGDGPDNYFGSLRRMVADYHLEEHVEFNPPVPIADMPVIYDDYDVLLLPSEWNEPLACVMLEAMAEGLLVIGTDTGGSGEVLVNNQTGFVFESGDPASLAQQISKVRSDRGKINRLAKAGYNQVVEEYNIENTVSRIETYLMNIINSE